MEFNENNSLIGEITTDESADVSGGSAKANFDVPGYTFIVGAGVAFGAGNETSRDYAFQQALFVSSTAPTGGGYTP